MARAANKAQVTGIIVSPAELGDATNVVDLLSIDGADAPKAQLTQALGARPNVVDDVLG